MKSPQPAVSCRGKKKDGSSCTQKVKQVDTGGFCHWHRDQEEIAVELVTHSHPDFDAIVCIWAAEQRLSDVLAREGIPAKYLPQLQRRFTADEVEPAERRFIFDIGAGRPDQRVFSNHPAGEWHGWSSVDIFFDWLKVRRVSKGMEAILKMVRLHDTKGRYLGGVAGKFFRDFHLITLLRGLNLAQGENPERVLQVLYPILDGIESYQPQKGDIAESRIVLDRLIALHLLQVHLQQVWPKAPSVSLDVPYPKEDKLAYLERQLRKVMSSHQNMVEILDKREQFFAPALVELFDLGEPKGDKSKWGRQQWQQWQEWFRNQPLLELVRRIAEYKKLLAPQLSNWWESRFLLPSMVTAMLKSDKVAAPLLLATVSQLLHASYLLKDDWLGAAADYRRGVKFPLKVFGQAAQQEEITLGVFRSERSGMAAYARKKGVKLILVKAVAGHIYFQTDQQSALKLVDLVKLLRVWEAHKLGLALPEEINQLESEECPLGVWYYMRQAEFILNGSPKRNAKHKTVLTLAEIVACVKLALDSGTFASQCLSRITRRKHPCVDCWMGPAHLAKCYGDKGRKSLVKRPNPKTLAEQQWRREHGEKFAQGAYQVFVRHFKQVRAVEEAKEQAK